MSEVNPPEPVDAHKGNAARNSPPSAMSSAAVNSSSTVWRSVTLLDAVRRPLPVRQPDYPRPTLPIQRGTRRRYSR